MSIVFAKEYWILKDWKSLSGGLRGRCPYFNIGWCYKKYDIAKNSIMEE